MDGRMRAGTRRRRAPIGVVAGAVAVLVAVLPAEESEVAVTRSATVGVDRPPAAAAAAVRAAVPLGGLEVPDPLALDSGGRVTSVRQWEQQRRPQLLEAFQENVYGTSLPAPTKTTFSEGSGGGGSAKKVTITVTGPEGTASFSLRLFTPSSGKPKGTFLLIDHRGSVGDDPGSGGYAPVSTITGDGFALAALNAEEVAPDDAGSADGGEDGVVAAAGAPADLLVGGVVLGGLLRVRGRDAVEAADGRQAQVGGGHACAPVVSLAMSDADSGCLPVR